MTKDHYIAWVERHTMEDEAGLWWWVEGDDIVSGPYSQEELYRLLWDAVLAGDAAP